MGRTQVIDRELLERVQALAERRQAPVSSLSVDELAAGLGMSRMTLYRRIGSRKALHAALRAAGHDPGEEPGAAERAIAAATALIEEEGLASVTLEAVATRAQCSLPTIYARFGGRSGLLMAVFERHSPVPVIAGALRPIPPGDGVAFRRCVSDIYALVFETFARERALLRALLAEALRDPASEIHAFLVGRYLPSIAATIIPWMQELITSGVARPLPPILMGQQFIAPILMHVATRSLVEEAGVFELPPRREVCDQLADLFCRAVGVAPDDADTSKGAER